MVVHTEEDKEEDWLRAHAPSLLEKCAIARGGQGGKKALCKKTAWRVHSPEKQAEAASRVFFGVRQKKAAQRREMFQGGGGAFSSLSRRRRKHAATTLGAPAASQCCREAVVGGHKVWAPLWVCFFWGGEGAACERRSFGALAPPLRRRRRLKVAP